MMLQLHSCSLPLKVLICFCTVLPSTGLRCQDNIIYGRITEYQTQIPLTGARVALKPTGKSALSDGEGAYLFREIPAGEYEVITDYLGYEAIQKSITVKPSDSLEVNFSLKPLMFELKEATVTGDRIIDRTSVSSMALKGSELIVSQGLLEDPLRTVSTLPGIGRSGDLFSPSQIYVRGGAPEENLFLLDNTVLFWPWYFGGQKSVYNSDMIDRIELLTGGFPATYGNHMSSVLSVTTRDGDFKHYQGNLSLGFYNSQMMVEGPIVKDKASFIASARRTYLDLFLKESPKIPVPSFGDITYKITCRISDRTLMSFSGLSSFEGINFLAADSRPGLPDKIETSGKTHTQSIQLQSTVNPEMHNKFSFTHAFSKSGVEVGKNISFDLTGRNLGARNDFTWFISANHKIKSGFEYYYDILAMKGNLPFNPEDIDPNDTTVFLQDFNLDAGRWRGALYSLYEGQVNRRISVNVGGRLDYNGTGNYADLSPRLSLRYQLTTLNEIRVAYGTYYQFADNFALGKNSSIRSNLCRHYILGFHHRFNSCFSGWVEAYYKDYSQLVVKDENLKYLNNGEGYSRGVELFLHKSCGKLKGWISYALSNARRKDSPYDRYYNFIFDQRHILNLVLEYEIKSSVTYRFLPSQISGNFRYADGTPFTPVVAAVTTPYGWQPLKGERNSARNTDYYNLNLRMDWKHRINKNGTLLISSFLEIWNLFNRKNVLGRTYRYGQEYPGNVNIQEYYTTPFLPAGGVKLSF